MSTQNLDPLPLRAARELEAAARRLLSELDSLEGDVAIQGVEARIAALRAAQALVAQHSAPADKPNACISRIRDEIMWPTFRDPNLRGVAVAQSERMP